MSTATPIETAYGEVFTSRWVVEAILDLVGYTPDRDLSKLRLVEPAVGAGAFFLPVVERLLASARIHGITVENLQEALFGLDLQNEHVESCRLSTRALLEAHGLSAEDSQRLSHGWIQHGDFLLHEVPTNINFVVGNPPYIRTEDLDDDVEATYRARWTTMRGRADIYVGFYERSLGLLAEGGRLGFICADRWMRNAYGKHLRQLVVSNYAVEAVWQMHDVRAFETEVSAYPAITILANAPQSKSIFIDTTALFNDESVEEVLAFTHGSREEDSGKGWTGARLPNWFKTSDFWPTGSPHTIKVLEQLQENFPALEDDGVTRIGIGVATGADKAYIVSKHAKVRVEPDRLLPIVMADDIRSGTLNTPAKLMINPWDKDGKLIDLASYSQFAETLSSHEAVQKRYVAKKNPASWHRTIDKVYPGLAEQPKLLFQDLKAQITPVLEPGGYYPHHNLYYIVSKTWDLEVLGGLLLSRVAEAFIRAYGVKMRGGTLRFQAQYLRKIAVPHPEGIPKSVADRLRSAFRTRDREEATRAAEEAYGLPAGTL